MTPTRRSHWVPAASSFAIWMVLSGCGTPGAPQPPSLNLPEPVSDLTAVRDGNQVTLHWTMPEKTTDRLRIKTQFRAPVRVLVCRGEPVCKSAGELALSAGAEGAFRDLLPPALSAGEPRRLVYFVELKNPKGRSAGPSNPAEVLAGAAPAPIRNLTAQPRPDGIALHWESSESQPSMVRLHRKLLTPASQPAKQSSGLARPTPEPAERSLLIDLPAPKGEPRNDEAALDSTAHFGNIYEYTAQRVERVAITGEKPMELAGEVSPAVRVDFADIFPPAVPVGLAAVFSPQEKTIDLSWEPDTEPDLAGYIVYRTESGGDWRRISSAEPLSEPSFRDSNLLPGRSYRYAVAAIDQTGHESRRSAEALETVPGP